MSYWLTVTLLKKWLGEVGSLGFFVCDFRFS